MTRTKLSMSAQVASIQDPERKRQMEDVAIQALLQDYAAAEAKGQTSYMNFIRGELRRLGYDDDYAVYDAGTMTLPHESNFDYKTNEEV